ncbi:hypothetical protein HMPREF0569_2402 [Micrococcus luteus SK58]|nr:hypothetical protein HMPREF0569_2402 [Micrococcus luteus SK58]SJN27823.1 SSU ribosomal protein S20p [Micrococcus luteus Mu201]
MSAGRRAPPERVIIGVPHAAQSTDPGTLHDPLFMRRPDPRPRRRRRRTRFG